jgi:hypothetical protein
MELDRPSWMVAFSMTVTSSPPQTPSKKGTEEEEEEQQQQEGRKKIKKGPRGRETEFAFIVLARRAAAGWPSHGGMCMKEKCSRAGHKAGGK